MPCLSRRLRALLPLLAGLAAVLGACCAPAGAATLAASDGRLSAFASYGAHGGTLTTVNGGFRSDALAFAARVSGLSGYDYSRGRFNVSWRAGSAVSYSGAFLLPSKFTTARSGHVALMRWDNYRASASWEQDSLNLNVATHLAWLVHETVTSGRVGIRTLAGPVPIPIGRWFTIRVSQTLGSGSGARNAVFVNGRRVAYSTRPNMVHSSATAVRYGIVALLGGAQRARTRLEFDRATAAGRPPSGVPVTAAGSGYVNPLSTPYSVGRTDMGVDLCLPAGAPIGAVGRGVVLGIDSDWYTDPATGKAQPYVWYRLLDGPDAGQVVYLAEQISLLVKVGQTVAAGQRIATYAKSGTCIEMGWGDPAGSGRTEAQVTTGYREGQVTAAGVSFAKFLISLGLTGPFELTATS